MRAKNGWYYVLLESDGGEESYSDWIEYVDGEWDSHHYPECSVTRIIKPKALKYASYKIVPGVGTIFNSCEE